MRNKVIRNKTRRLTAVLLVLLMTMGSFSVAAFAQEVPEEEAVKTTETAPVESAPSGEAKAPSAEAAQPSSAAVAQPSAAEASQPSAAVQPAAESSQPEGNVTPVTDTPQEGSSNVTEEAQTETAEVQITEDKQAAEPDQTEGLQAPAASEVSEKEVTSPSAVQPQAVLAEAKNAGSGDAGTHKIAVDGSAVERGISLAFYIKSGNVITEYVYDGTTITDTTNDKDVTDIGITVAAGSLLTVQQVLGLTDDYQQGSSPGGKSTRQLKLVLKDSSGKELQRVSLNNSTTMTSTSVSLDNVAAAVIGIAGRIKVTMGTDIYHKGSCIIMNTTDSGQKQSEHGDIFAMAGDKISIDYGPGDYYDHIDVSVTDTAGKSVAYSGGSFTMPSSPADLKMIFYYKAKNVNVVNPRPERGTISVKKDQYRPGDKVVIKIRSNSGYRFSTKTLAYTYMKDGKLTLQKITKDKDGKYSFIMPFYDIDIRGVFVANETASGSSDPSSFIEYTAYADDEEEDEAEAIPAEEEELQQMLDVTPLVSRVVAETVMTATVSMAALIN